MRLILNIIWLIFGGLWLALGYLVAAAGPPSGRVTARSGRTPRAGSPGASWM